jgi:8-oxo-dGTP pyrophosphatase MutT (NUDIX family)
MTLNVDQVANGFDGPGIGAPLPTSGRAAAVAIILAGKPTAPSMCFIRRVERPGDRWSGDVAFPGGWAQDDDGSLKGTAIRETAEEVGVDLHQARHLGCLAPEPIGGSTGSMGLIAASVFDAGHRILPLVPEERELASAFWVPTAHLLDPANITSVDWSGNNMPGIAFEDHVIWGLTHRLLKTFLRNVGQ